MALDPNIILGARAPQFDMSQFSPVNTLATAMKLKQLQQEGDINALNLRERRGLQEYLSGGREVDAPNLGSPEARTTLATRFGETGRKVATSLTDIDKAQAALLKADTDEKVRRNALTVSKTAQYRDLLSNVNDQRSALQWIQLQQQDPDLADSPIAKVSIMDAARSIPADPAGFAQWKQQAGLGISKFLELNKPVTFAQDIGGTGRLMSRPGLGGEATVVPGSEFTKTMTPAQIATNKIAQEQLDVSQRQLILEQQKFAFEKANPGFELKEDADGNFFGVNKRTLQAIPVMVGGAAPAAAPAMPGAGMPGPRVPALATQAIPGMTSVLNQPAPAAAAGVPFRGKGTALTESQGNATAYGMRMREANAILEPLETAGKTNTGVIKGVVGGTLGLVPFIGEKLEDASGSIFNALPQVLGGLSPKQQQVMQARINFITAILRKESGAAIGANEFATAEKNYFPKPGDDAATIAQKQQARKTAIRAMEIQAGPGARQMGGAGVIPGASANNPLGLPGL
jgi:hypothetical protein